MFKNANLHINILTRRISARYVNRSVDKVTVSGKESFVTNLNTVFWWPNNGYNGR